ncbi:MAG: cytochrome c551/c552, partial [Rhodothermales bacterium]
TMLTAKVLAGGTGVWGQTPMPPHPTLKDNDVARMIEAILLIESPESAKKAERKERKKKKDGKKN